MIKYEVEEYIAYITLNNTQEFNAITPSMKEEFYKYLLKSEKDENVKVVIINGKGKHFCSGSNVKKMGDRTVQQTINHMHNFNEIIKHIYSSEKIFITAIQGYCIGGGVGLALASDINYATKDIQIGFTFTKIGLIPDCGTLYHLPRLVGKRKAKELIFNAKMIEAKEAFNLGLINEIVESDQLMDKALSHAKELLKGPSLALSWSKKIINQSDNNTLESVLEFERLGQTVMQQSSDHKEGVNAFKEKRKPVFSGE